MEIVIGAVIGGTLGCLYVVLRRRAMGIEAEIRRNRWDAMYREMFGENR